MLLQYVFNNHSMYLFCCCSTEHRKIDKQPLREVCRVWMPIKQFKISRNMYVLFT